MRLADPCRVSWCLNPAIRDGWCFTHRHQHPIPPPMSHVTVRRRVWANESPARAAFYDEWPPIPGLFADEDEAAS